MFEGFRDKWEHMTPRERSLMALLGVSAVVVVFAFVGMTIREGLDEIAARNDARRDALDALEIYRAQKAQGTDDGPKISIPNEALDLPAYLEDIAKEVGIEIPNYQPQPQAQRGSYDEIAVNIDLREVTVQELADFMERVETRNRTVVVTQLRIERSFRDQDRLRKASMTVATFAKRAATGGEDAADSEADEGDEGDEGEEG